MFYPTVTHQQNVQLKDDISEWLEWPYLVVRPATLRASLVFLRRLESHMTCWFHCWHTLKTNKTCPHKPIFINTYNRVLNSPKTEKNPNVDQWLNEWLKCGRPTQRNIDYKKYQYMSEYNGRCSNAKEKPVTKHYIFFIPLTWLFKICKSTERETSLVVAKK